MKFQITFNKNVSHTVEADSIDEAIEMAAHNDVRNGCYGVLEESDNIDIDSVGLNGFYDVSLNYPVVVGNKKYFIDLDNLGIKIKK